MSMLGERLGEIERAKEARAKLMAAPPADEMTDDSTIAYLASLEAMEYDRKREAAAKGLGVRVATLDDRVRKVRGGEKIIDGGNGHAVLFEEPEPWSAAVDGPKLLDDLRECFSRFLVLPVKGADVLALWTIHAHTHETAICSPRLNITAPEKGCGKTTALDVLQAVTPKALRTENVTTAVLFRLVDEHAPTLLIDECDSFLKDNNELRGALNAGHRRGGCHLRCEGDQNKVRSFKTFAPTALAGIRALPGTLADRSIIVTMQRAKPGEILERFDARRIEGLTALKRQAARWARDNQAALEAADPDMGELHNRRADNWRGLFAIADLVGENWPRRARSAAVVSSSEATDETALILMLEDLRRLFTVRRADRLTSGDLCEHLAGLEDRPWPEWRQNRPITARQLAALLSPFGIRPRLYKFAGTAARGYQAADFSDAFSRYLPTPPALSVTPLLTAETKGFQDSPPVTGSNSERTKTFGKPRQARKVTE